MQTRYLLLIFDYNSLKNSWIWCKKDQNIHTLELFLGGIDLILRTPKQIMFWVFLAYCGGHVEGGVRVSPLRDHLQVTAPCLSQAAAGRGRLPRPRHPTALHPHPAAPRLGAVSTVTARTAH